MPVNGTDTTRFSSDEDQKSGIYYQVNMGSAQIFDDSDMAVPNSPNDYARAFDVEVSSDAVNWRTVATCPATDEGPVQIVSFPQATAQYLRVSQTTSSTTNWWSINQFFVFGPGAATSTTTSPSTTTTTTIVPGSNCSPPTFGPELSETNIVATSDVPYNSTDGPQNAITNAITDSFTPLFLTNGIQTVGQYFEVNMGSQQTVGGEDMLNQVSSGTWAQAFNVELSTDGITWTTVASCAGTYNDPVTFTPQVAQYVRIVLTESSSTEDWSIAQFFVSAPVPPPETTTTVIP